MLNNNIIQEIKENYKKMESAIIEELFITVNNHHLTAGTFREKIWKELFENIVPKKFTIEQGAFLIDSDGNVSNEIDLVVFDEQYTPYILKNKNIKFIPIEAVMIVIQCKSNSFSQDDLQAWEKSIDNVKVKDSGIAGSAVSSMIYNGKRKIIPLKVICGTFCEKEKKKIEKFLLEKSTSTLLISAYSKQTGATYSCGVDKNGKKIIKNIYKSSDKKLTIYNKYEDLKKLIKSIVTELDYEKLEKEFLEKNIESRIEAFEIFHENEKLSLLTLMFQVNQYLMLINNPVLFPHKAYIDMFNEENKEKEE